MFVLRYPLTRLDAKRHRESGDGSGGGPGVDRRNFERFRGLCESAFLTVRRNGSLVISILAMMISTGLPELSSEQVSR